jgi:alpha-beta hydrolase superfamily lysophospholipase
MLAPRPRVFLPVAAAVGICAAGVAASRALPVRVEAHPPVPPPAGATFLLARDGTRLFEDVDAPAEPRALVWLVQGLEAERELPFPALRVALRRAGVGVAMLHLRGTGFSEGPRGDVDDFGKLLEDGRTFARALRARFPGTPIALVGHGAGAPFALETAASLADEVRFDGVVLLNPALGAGDLPSGLGDRARYAAFLLLRPGSPTLAAGAEPSGLRDASDRHDAERARADPLRVPRRSTRLVAGLRALGDGALENARAARAPLLVISGKDDVLADPSTGDALAGAWGGPRAEVRHVWGGHGTAFVERNADAVVAFVTRTCARTSG